MIDRNSHTIVPLSTTLWMSRTVGQSWRQPQVHVGEIGVMNLSMGHSPYVATPPPNHSANDDG
uniref:Uncharacterized protein n=1 Tax=Glossina austeni TaxID=7395 RepID=A0A1A9UIB0_GLOAU